MVYSPNETKIQKEEKSLNNQHLQDKWTKNIIMKQQFQTKWRNGPNGDISPSKKVVTKNQSLFVK